ncbi:SAG-related sequence [Besnoitia besnoiti]|uniref:SAG-related sequence n=1 Tax=Besnoitia besnoiti TaxID=94643 RepID=A0A2A9MLN5_BESBE|nr:SAG-related sequence [Besnoitia besnoiti]PFH36956.1 SAG-related sequence [Besnoitia besnoiti]
MTLANICVRAVGLLSVLSLALAVRGPHASSATAAVPADTTETGAPTENTCNADKSGEKSLLELFLEPDVASISFKCGAGLTELKPSGSQVYVEQERDKAEALANVCNGASLDVKGQDSDKTYTLTVMEKPANEKVLFYRCESPAQSDQNLKGTLEAKKCTVKITVRAEKKSDTSAAPWLALPPLGALIALPLACA